MLLLMSLMGLITHSGSCPCVRLELENLLRRFLHAEDNCEVSSLCDMPPRIVIFNSRECLSRKEVS